jgi:hypothetical protein
MEKVKTKTTVRAKKAEPAVKTSRSKASVKSIPGENEIRMKAQEIYNDRVRKGIHGTAEDDWIKAEKLLKG